MAVAAARVDYMFNMTSLMMGYDPHSKFDAILFAGAGAAGGMGFAFLAYTNAVLESGVKIILEETARKGMYL